MLTNTISVSAFQEPNFQSQMNLLREQQLAIEGVLSVYSLTGYRILLTNVDVHNIDNQ